jgi:hypothetical protein
MPKIVEGCLSQSSADNSFALVDDSGNRYKLTGDTSSLASLVGQQVQVTGAPAQSQSSSASSTPPSASSSSSDVNGSATKGSTPGSASEANANNNSASSSEQNQLNVSSAKSIASVCRQQSK